MLMEELELGSIQFQECEGLKSCFIKTKEFSVLKGRLQDREEIKQKTNKRY